jgi:subtilisin-like proprotein convertase family protein
MYDYGIENGDAGIRPGLGAYCVMALGSRINFGRNPSAICAYLRDLAGWTRQEVLLNSPDQYEIMHEDYQTVFRYETDCPNEYFLVENRTRLGLDAYLPSGGLAVYHCDTLGKNGWGKGSPDSHSRCRLIQADGALHLETGDNCGDRFDLFGKTDGVALSYGTIPSSKSWNGADSGFNLVDISEPGQVMRFKTGRTRERGESDVSGTPLIMREIFPDMLIPDDDAGGLCTAIPVDVQGILTDILVNVDITHLSVGDLEVLLKPPSGEVFFLHNLDWSQQNDLHLTCDAESVLAGLKGKPIYGDWVLCVRDLVAKEIGKLNSWNLLIEYFPSAHMIQTEAVSGLKIPNADPNGISSAIPISQDGPAKDIRVFVEINHPFSGDLQVVLIAPTGRSVVLISFGEGKNKANIRRAFDTDTHPGLAVLVKGGQPITGDWLLQVADNGWEGPGTLERWSLALTC